MQKSFYLISVVLVLVNAHSSKSDTYYASPSGGGDGKSVSSPFKIDDFWSAAQPGDVLLLLDGKYTGSASMINPPQGLSGTAEKEITVKALNDGKVEIDGAFAHKPVYLNSNSHFIIEGVNAHSSPGFAVIQLNGNSNNNIIRRVCAWDSGSLTDNSEIFGVHGSINNLFEDCAGWGRARKIFQNSYDGNFTTFRRCWGRFEANTRSGPKQVFALAYNSHNNIAENCIGTWDEQVSDIPEKWGIFTFNRQDGDQNSNSKYLGCVAYITQDQRADFLGTYFKPNNVSSASFVDCISFVDPTHDVRTFFLNGQGTNLKGKGLTSVGSRGSSITSEWEIENLLELNSSETLINNNEHILQAKQGATVMKRYVNGVLTDEDLWPWPMNQRIIDALIQSGRKPIDVTRTVFELGGGKMPNFETSLNTTGNATTTSGNAPLEISFTASATGGSPPYNYFWEFGDGNTSTEQNPTHVFTSPGIFNLKLSVTDGAGNKAFSNKTINVYEGNQALSIVDMAFVEAGQTQESDSLKTDTWYDLYLYVGTPAVDWSEIAFADIWLSHADYTEGTISNRGGNFYSGSNYVMSYSISDQKIWARQTEASSQWENLTGQAGLYIQDLNHEYEQNPSEGWVKARIKLLTQAKLNNWSVNAFVKNRDGVISNLYQENFFVLHRDVHPPSKPRNLRAEYMN